VGSWGGACGKANDQGISFRALGFFAAGDGSLTDSGASISLTDDFQVPADVDCDKKITETDGGILGVENNLIQGIALDHVDISYRVPGSSISIPPFTFALAARLGPSSGQEPNNPPIVYRRIIVVPSSVLQFLNDSRSILPDVPFTMIADATAVGVADTGEPFRTNRVSYQMTMFDGARSCESPTPAPTGGGGTPGSGTPGSGTPGSGTPAGSSTPLPNPTPTLGPQGAGCSAASQCASGACSGVTNKCLGVGGDPCSDDTVCKSGTCNPTLGTCT
jgi:hypothetical protein